MQMRAETGFRFFRPADLLVPVVVILVVLISRHAEGEYRGQSLVLEVHAGGATTLYPLQEDTLFQVTGNLGPLEVEIDSCRARISESPCPGQDCVKAGWLSENGDLSICVPSGVFLVIASPGDSNDSPDAVTY